MSILQGALERASFHLLLAEVEFTNIQSTGKNARGTHWLQIPVATACQYIPIGKELIFEPPRPNGAELNACQLVGLVNACRLVGDGNACHDICNHNTCGRGGPVRS